MNHFLLIGPLGARFADDHFGYGRHERTLLTFGRSKTDIRLMPGDSWDILESRIPHDFPATTVILNLGYTALPSGFESTGKLLTGYAPDWALHWHYYCRLSSRLDRLWADHAGCELLHRAGIDNARPIMPFGLPSTIAETAVNVPREIDLLWIGNLNPDIHPERLRWARRIARLGERYRVVIGDTVNPDLCRPLLRRSRAVFLPSFHGGWDWLVPEAMAAGAVVIRDDKVHEVAGGPAPEQEYLVVNDDNFEEVLEDLMANEPRRRSIASAAQARSPEFRSPALWQRLEMALREDVGDFRSDRRSRSPEISAPGWELQHWQFLNIRADVPNAADQATEPKEQLAGAVRLAWKNTDNGPALDPLRRLTSDVEVGFAASLHLAEACSERDCIAEALPLVHEMLQRLEGPDELPEILLGFGPLRPGFNPFRVAWERAAFSNIADTAAQLIAKRNLLRARVELLLGRITADSTALVRAAEIAPDFAPAVKAAALARVDGPASTIISSLEKAFAADPFDRELAARLDKELHRNGRVLDLATLRRDLELLIQARQFPKSILDAPAVPAAPRKQRVSLTMIVRNEEANLGACLDSVKDLVDEIVVVDTGSTDRTAAVAIERGARVTSFRWCDDFAAARNAAIDAAHGDWILWLDADERLGPEARIKLRQLISELKDENAAYLMRQLSQSAEAMGSDTAIDQLRLFRNQRSVRWEYRIHEQILISIRRTGASIRDSGVVIDHHGYEDPNLRLAKSQRNTRILEIAHAEKPDDPVIAFNLAWVYQKAEPQKAIPLLELCKQRLAPHVSIVPKVHSLLGKSLSSLDRSAEALDAYAAGLRLFPRDIELLFYHGMLQRKQKNYRAAEDSFKRILGLSTETYPAGVDLRLRGYKTRNALAELYQELRRFDDAAREWQAAVNEQPDFTLGWVGLAEVELAQGRKKQAADFLKKIPSNDPHTHFRRMRVQKALTVDERRAPGFAPTTTSPATPTKAIVPSAVKPKLAGDERSSIIVLASNQEHLTSQCLNSVVEHTSGDYELILVDNGSKDNTPELFRSFGQRKGPTRVKVIQNPINRGFAAGANQALSIAEGEFIVLLNNDTIVTPGWLTDLKRLSLYDWPSVGMVGPVTNGAPAPQFVKPDYEHLKGLVDFANRRRLEYGGHVSEVKRLTGFCLLIRAEVLKLCGGKFDEQFGIGFFEDDDLCMRVRNAGFRLLLAHEVYIHHFWNQTFKSLGINPKEQLKKNLEIFRRKWGDEAASVYRIQGVGAQEIETGSENV